jgi:glycerol-3-phosphate acyltransferase PlsX
VEGIDIARRRLPQVRFLTFGDAKQLEPLFARFPDARAVCEIRHTEDVITNETKPSAALRQGKNSSMRLAIDAVGTGEAAGVVSAGNTGALMALAKFVLKTLPGIDRPAIATFFPTERSASIMLDLGANVECDEHNLVQFAVMGEVFARNVLNLEQPSIGLLNIGSEVLKGNEAVRKASAILQKSDLPIKFHGFIEGTDIAAGTVDVIVTDGFTGNVALKTAEGTAHMIIKELRKALTGSILAKIGTLLARKQLLAFRERLDPRRYNGAMFVGLNGICVKSHGGTDPLGFANAIDVAVNLVEHGFNDRIKEDLTHLFSDTQEPQAAAL